ncbi:MAG: hypothetical protein KGH79_03220 [Patescibacteria group bacterium]|nr:hypothetical protein [Patescibacteria group bacterium]
MNTKLLEWTTVGIAATLFAGAVIWLLFFRPTASLQSTNQPSSFDTATNNSTSVGVSTSSSNINSTQTINSTSQTSQQKIFEISQGPVVGATLIQTLNPTTTLARYINQTDGHVYDLPLDVPGAIPRVVSNVTIPGGERAVWFQQGNAAIIQYLNNNTIKTAYLGFPPASTTAGTLPTTIKFLPDNIVDLAASPDGKSVVYLLSTASGVDGYIAKYDGTGAKKLFSLPLSQVLVSWSSQSLLLVQTKSAAGVSGIAFAVDAKSGAITPLINAQGLTITANPSFSMLLYQISDGVTRTSYLHDVKSGLNAPVATINPSPEQCIWSSLTNTVAFCAEPIQYVPANYFDLWHQGTASAADDIFKVFSNINGVSVVASPGSSDGGSAADISEMSLSPDEHYLEYVTKGDRSVWGVRLTQ